MVFRKPSGVQAAKALSRHGPLLISTESHPVKTGISSKSGLAIVLIASAGEKLYSFLAESCPTCPRLILTILYGARRHPAFHCSAFIIHKVAAILLY